MGDLITGMAITVLLAGFVVLLIGSRDRQLLMVPVSTEQEEPTVVLVVKIHEIDGRLVMVAAGPGGSYRLAHSMFAAAALSAEVVRQADAGVEGGLQLMQEQTMHVLKNGVEA